MLALNLHFLFVTSRCQRAHVTKTLPRLLNFSRSCRRSKVRRPPHDRSWTAAGIRASGCRSCCRYPCSSCFHTELIHFVGLLNFCSLLMFFLCEGERDEHRSAEGSAPQGETPHWISTLGDGTLIEAL